ncbi:hypothetical protein RRG08_062470 [Elysia crispata]|uniref:Uncharacterized protein n=1 Tax=Elysia crispata TaxID=231223 RepID=A0AAE0XNL5_9GAST|nr:hypothetical protein RRG08_062470 [Elysia crispata]
MMKCLMTLEWLMTKSKSTLKPACYRTAVCVKTQSQPILAVILNRKPGLIPALPGRSEPFYRLMVPQRLTEAGKSSPM